ncbi:hypothetical protein DVB69_09770 [Sporosarcina sp. BI001-red]|uniref:hypothetical protein n=1 Tax=Sporosarcina sp. BI001-red TaxID=2282866 RepID=UPI000E271A26|nr:hypothetical protein [Sporosarcina sp. BI001-red]REB07134.1 hypothetical protein DVB69_09770 [Sporosarcina sp. BI001-red]
MVLFGFIAVATILGLLLLMIAGPLGGGILAFGIVVGCIFWGLYLLNDIHKKIFATSPKKDKVQRAYEQYLSERSDGLE